MQIKVFGIKHFIYTSEEFSIINVFGLTSETTGHLAISELINWEAKQRLLSGGPEVKAFCRWQYLSVTRSDFC